MGILVRRLEEADRKERAYTERRRMAHSTAQLQLEGILDSIPTWLAELLVPIDNLTRRNSLIEVEIRGRQLQLEGRIEDRSKPVVILRFAGKDAGRVERHRVHGWVATWTRGDKRFRKPFRQDILERMLADVLA